MQMLGQKMLRYLQGVTEKTSPEEKAGKGVNTRNKID